MLHTKIKRVAATCMVAFIATTTPLCVNAQAEAASSLSPEQAAAAVTAQMLGQQLPPELASETARFLRDSASSRSGNRSADMTAFGEDLTRFLMGVLASGGPAPVDLSQFGRAAVPVIPGSGAPDVSQIYAAYGLANTAAYLVAAYAVPDLGPYVIPHNVRVVADYVQTDTNTITTGEAFLPFVTGGIRQGDSFTIATTLDVDTLLATALDQHSVNDLIMLQIPLSTTVSVTTTCTRGGSFFGFRFCREVNVDTQVANNDKVLATNPTYTVAYPLNAGTFATRAEATDLFQVVYDALGNLHSQKPRDSVAQSPFARIPGLEFLAPGTGLADLGTQAPPVNFYGAQASENSLAQTLASGVVSPLLTAINEDAIDVRTVPTTPGALPLTANVLLNGTTLLNADTVLDARLGVTAGYRAAELRTGTINLMVLRWHNIGTQTLGEGLDALTGGLLSPVTGELVSAPASLYYDVPPGEYSLSDNRSDGRNAVYANDFKVAAEPPPLNVPPNLPNLGELQALADQIAALLGGETTPEVPGLP